MASKRKLGETKEVDDVVDPSDELMFLCLGGGNEVGRSCHIIQYKGKTVMFDAGMHPAYEGLTALPFYDEFDLSQVDVLLVSHFHVDHAASLPYVLAKTPFKGRTFMTHPTKAIYKWLIQDSVRVGNLTSSAESRNNLYTEQDHLNTFPRIEAIDFYTTHNVSGIKITPYPAGHVLGAAMYLVEIAGLKILFTGDYSREDDRHLVSATAPKGVKVDLLICESTFGTALHTPRQERETALMKSITTILDRGGRVLMPTFALGTAQELLLILDEYWSKHPRYQKIPIYYASNLARKCMAVYQTYISAMNDNIKRLFRERMAEAEKAGGDLAKAGAGPWDFKFVRALKSLERFEDLGSCVMLATPGMMQNGASRELLERWAPDAKNGVVITGYSVEGTMAQMLLNEPESINAVMTRNSAAARRGPGLGGRSDEPITIPRRCSVQEFSFAAHVDGQQNREFVEEVNAPVVILVHGARNMMTRFKSKLLSLNASRPPSAQVKVFSPANCEELRIPFPKPKIAKVVGRLAQQYKPPQKGEPPVTISGVMVRGEDMSMQFMAVEDLPEYAGLPITRILERLHLNLGIGVELIRWGLSGYFGGIQEVANAKSKSNGHNAQGTKSTVDEDVDDETKRRTTKYPDIEDKGQITTFIVMDTVLVYVKPGGLIELVWEGNAMNDSIGDAVVAGLTGIAMSPAGVKFSEANRAHSHDHANEKHSNTKNGIHIDSPDDNDDDAASTASKTSDSSDKLLASLDSPDEKKTFSNPLEAKIHKRFVANKHPQADWSDAERLERFCWFLEAQFGEGYWSPLVVPRKFFDGATMGLKGRLAEGIEVITNANDKNEALDLSSLIPTLPTPAEVPSLVADLPLTSAEKAMLKTTECQSELALLAGSGVLIPGFELKLDEAGKSLARIWCEDMDVECDASKVWRDRIVAVLANAVRVLRPLGRSFAGGSDVANEDMMEVDGMPGGARWLA